MPIVALNHALTCAHLLAQRFDGCAYAGARRKPQSGIGVPQRRQHMAILSVPVLEPARIEQMPECRLVAM